MQSVEYAERVSGIAFVTVAEAESIRQFLKLPDLSILAKAKLSCSRDMFTRWALKKAIAAAPAGEEIPQTSLTLKQRKEWNKLVLAYWKGERKAPPAIRVRIIDAGDLCIFGLKVGLSTLKGREAWMKPKRKDGQGYLLLVDDSCKPLRDPHGRKLRKIVMFENGMLCLPRPDWSKKS